MDPQRVLRERSRRSSIASLLMSGDMDGEAYVPEYDEHDAEGVDPLNPPEDINTQIFNKIRGRVCV